MAPCYKSVPSFLKSAICPYIAVTSRSKARAVGPMSFGPTYGPQFHYEASPESLSLVCGLKAVGLPDIRILVWLCLVVDSSTAIPHPRTGDILRLTVVIPSRDSMGKRY